MLHAMTSLLRCLDSRKTKAVGLAMAMACLGACDALKDALKKDQADAGTTAVAVAVTPATATAVATAPAEPPAAATTPVAPLAAAAAGTAATPRVGAKATSPDAGKVVGTDAGKVEAADAGSAIPTPTPKVNFPTIPAIPGFDAGAFKLPAGFPTTIPTIPTPPK
jgi:hypothetical protein